MSTPGMHKCSCQACGGHIEYPPEYEGMEFACPHCGQGTCVQLPKIQVTSDSSATAASQVDSMEPPSTSTPEESIQASEPEPDNGPDPYVCENCGADMVPEDKVCVECGHRRSSVSKWTGMAVFRLIAGIVLLGELAVLGLQWTTEGKPFGLRQRTRDAVLIKMGLREGIDPAKQAALSGTDPQGTIEAVAKDPDLKLKSHQIKPDKDNGALYIRGVVENVSEYRYLAVRVKFDLKDAGGNIIPGGEVSAYQKSIEPGKEWPFKVLVLDPDATTYTPILPIEGYR